MRGPASSTTAEIYLQTHEQTTASTAPHPKTSVIREKGESQNVCFKKQSTPNFPKNEHFLPPATHTMAALKFLQIFQNNNVIEVLRTTALC